MLTKDKEHELGLRALGRGSSTPARADGEKGEVARSLSSRRAAGRKAAVAGRAGPSSARRSSSAVYAFERPRRRRSSRSRRPPAAPLPQDLAAGPPTEKHDSNNDVEAPPLLLLPTMSTQDLHALRTQALTEAFGAQASGFAGLLDDTAKVAFDSCELDVLHSSSGGGGTFQGTRRVEGGGAQSLEAVGMVGREGELV